MGYELRRQLADELPAELSSGERLVALELADQANDHTRIAYGHNLLEVVARRCGFAGEKQVGKILGKLAKRGIELRVQIVRDDGAPLFDKRGRPVFAYDGRETTYKIPDPGAPVVPPPEDHSTEVVPQTGEHFSTDRSSEVPLLGDLSLSVVTRTGDHLSTDAPPPGRPQDASGPPPGSKCSPAGIQVVPRPGDPSPHFTSDTPQSVDAGASARTRKAHRWLTANYRLTDAECEQVLDKVQARAPRRIDDYVRYMAPMVEEGTLADIVGAVQTRRTSDEPNDDDPAPPHLTLAPHERTVREAIAAVIPRPVQPPIMAAVPDPPPQTATRTGPPPEYWAIKARKYPHLIPEAAGA